LSVFVLRIEEIIKTWLIFSRYCLCSQSLSKLQVVAIVEQFISTEHADIENIFVKLDGVLNAIFIKVLDGVVVVVVGINGDEIKTINCRPKRSRRLRSKVRCDNSS
jgi:hypothetical protein